MNAIIKKLSYLKYVFIATVFILLVVESKNFISAENISLLQKSFHSLSNLQWATLLFLGIFCFSPMIFYDFLLKSRLEMDVPWYKLTQYGWISNSVSNLVGLGGVAGLTLRTYFYKKHHDEPKKIIKESSKIMALNFTGLSVLCIFFLFSLLFKQTPLDLKLSNIAVIIMAAYFPILIGILLYRENKRSTQFEFKHLALVTSVSIIQWTFILLLIYLIGIVVGIEISFYDYVPLFITACCLAIISMIPGGLGSFDLTLLVGLQGLGVQNDQALLLLLLYRLTYYIIPFFIGILLFFRVGWKKFNENWMGVPESILTFFLHKVLILLTFLSGAVLLLSASLPAMVDRIKLMNSIVSLPFMAFSHQVSIALGFCLIIIATLLKYRVKHVYIVSMITLILGATFTLFKGFDYEEALFILFVAWMLFLTRKTYSKKAFVVMPTKIFLDSFTLLFFTLLYMLVSYSHSDIVISKFPKSIQGFFINTSSNSFENALVGLLIAILILLIVYIWNGRPKFPFIEFKDDQYEIETHINEWGGNPLSHLIYSGNKKFYWSQDRTVLFIFQVKAGKIVVLSDPIGNPNHFSHATEEFLMDASNYGWDVTFYQVRRNLLHTLHEKGYDFFKLGEEGMVNTEDFNLSGKKRKNQRAIKNKLEKDGYTATVLAPPFNHDLLSQLKEVSDEWLDSRNEKHFSLGSFSNSYLQSAPIIIVRDTEDQIVAFATLMPLYNNSESLSIDLMRFKKNAPSGIMEYLFIELIEYAKASGYEKFNIGMAPLANVGNSKFSFISEKLACQIYLHGQFFYSFQGLRTFKNKFTHEWEPRYLAYQKKTSLPFTMMKVTSLISNGEDYLFQTDEAKYFPVDYLYKVTKLNKARKTS